jgi:DNA-binding transcriptional LysR family regulator
LNDGYHLVDAVRSGLGLAYIPQDLIQTDLDQGRLIRVLADYSIQFSGFHLYYPHRRQQSPALKLVIETLRVTDYRK